MVNVVVAPLTRQEQEYYPVSLSVSPPEQDYFMEGEVRLPYNNSGPIKMCWSKLKWPQNEKRSRLGILFVPQL